MAAPGKRAISQGHQPDDLGRPLRPGRALVVASVLTVCPNAPVPMWRDSWLPDRIPPDSCSARWEIPTDLFHGLRTAVDGEKDSSQIVRGVGEGSILAATFPRCFAQPFPF
jgi:hypothetical protein